MLLVRAILRIPSTDVNKDFSYKNQDQFKDLWNKDQDKDKDFKTLLARTRTRTKTWVSRTRWRLLTTFNSKNKQQIIIVTAKFGNMVIVSVCLTANNNNHDIRVSIMLIYFYERLWSKHCKCIFGSFALNVLATLQFWQLHWVALQVQLCLQNWVTYFCTMRPDYEATLRK